MASGGRRAARRNGERWDATGRRLHWWNRGSGIRLRIWMLVHSLVLVALCGGVYGAVVSNSRGPAYRGLGVPAQSPGLIGRLVGSSGPSGLARPTKQQIMEPDGLYFGTTTRQAPFSASEVDRVAALDGGVRPTMTQYFGTWSKPFDRKAVADAYAHGTFPVLTWEPWDDGDQNVANAAHGTIPAGNIDKPDYRLSDIIDGRYDAYITAYAKAVAADGWPIGMRFAHEMNGVWYSWAEKVNGNKPGQYVLAWRHVHDLFVKAGATNVIWIWSPNIIRPVPHTALKPLYPGDDYVDWIGLTGYKSLTESTPQQTFGPTLDEISSFTDKPVLITETGAEPAANKASWIAAFFPWMRSDPNIIGFIWTQEDQQDGVNGDWRFSTDDASRQAFSRGLGTLRLADGLSGTAKTTARPSPGGSPPSSSGPPSPGTGGTAVAGGRASAGAGRVS